MNELFCYLIQFIQFLTLNINKNLRRMSFFGVQLNAQVNRLVLNIKLTLGKNKYLPNFRTIYGSFVKFDTEQSGCVRLDQFDKALGQNGIFLKKFELQVFQKAFKQQNGKVNWFSLMSLLRQPMNAHRNDAIQKIFDVIDQNHNGRVHYSELMNRFNASEIKQFKLGFKSRQRIGEQLIQLVPLTEDGFMTRQEFVSFYNDLSLNISDDQTFIKFACSHWNVPYVPCKQVRSEDVKSAIKLLRFKLIQRTQGTHQEFILKQIFNEFDVNKNNELCLDQLQKMLVKLQIPVQEKFTKQILAKMDHNGNGKVDFQEFKNFIFYDAFEI